jgi:hypothetical protein
MSLGTVIKAIFAGTKTFLEKVEAEFIKLFKAAPSVLQAASTFVTFAAPIIVGLEALIDPLLAPETTAILAIVKTDLATLAAASASLATATTAGQALTNLEAVLPQLLGVGEIKDAALAAKIEAAVTTIGGELTALVTAFEAWLANLNAPAPAA